MSQVARNLTDPVDGFLREMRYQILDRDDKFTAQFKETLRGAGVKLVTTVYQTMASSSSTSDSVECSAATATRPDGDP